ncbi:hypothetical protein [Planctobacterium marinum]|uniref:hypothetical protein n=1 Tax=Planctobacterium marinum TaxID=1631968 RepID=UPI001E64BA12|nr:hypothetical protein [Planctobacterium marinum]MCC2607170.1 hypothetical protein [Planctobacterium marinum]
MTSPDTNRPATREALTKELLEHYQCQPKLSKLKEAQPQLEAQFQFPRKVWEKLRAKN